MATAKFKQDKAGGWLPDPSGDDLDIIHEAGGLVYLRHPEHGFVIGVPKGALSPPVAAKKEPPSGIQGKDGQ